MNCKFSESAQRGSILLLLMVMVVILGLLSGLAGQSWKTIMQREREAELLWRGQQYQKAIGSYNKRNRDFPSKLEDLVRDPRAPGVVRHLRKLYNDPMTGDDWVLVKDPAQKLVGVRSKSNIMPFKLYGFPEPLAKLEGKNSYSQWEFVYVPQKVKQRSNRSSTVPVPKSTEP